MSGEFPFAPKIVSPVKCNEKPWDLWINEIGHSSPRRDDDSAVAFLSPADVKTNVTSRRLLEVHPYKSSDRGHARYRRAGLNRLKFDSFSLHGMFPQMDNLNAAVCHMCGLIVKCSAAYRHLIESHAGSEPILPPPPPTPTVRLKNVHSRSRHKKDVIPAPQPVDMLPVKMESSPVHTAAAPLSRIVLPHPDLQYIDETNTSAALTGEVQVCMESGELPVVSIQDTEDLHLGENITDDIFAIMNSEGIQSADDITNSADWKNIIRDIGNMQDINFSQAPDTFQPQDLYTPVDTAALSAYPMTDTDLSSLQFAPNTSPMLSSVIDSNLLNAQALKPVVTASGTSIVSTTKSQSRPKSKSKFNSREYDPNKHCGVVTVENPKPCTRSLTCKAHALSLRRTVEGRSKPFDTLLAEHRASKDANTAALSTTVPVPPLLLTPPAHMTSAPTTVPLSIPPILVNTPIDLGTFNNLTAEQQVNDIYTSLLSVEDPNSVLPDTSSITSLLSQPLQADSFLLPDDMEIPNDVSILNIPSPTETTPLIKIEDVPEEGPLPLVSTDVCWYSSCPRPLALCTFNASHAGGAITLGKKFATVRSNIKSSLSRSQSKSTGTANSFYYNQNALSLSKTVHMNNSSKTTKPEVRKLIVTCSATSGGNKEMHQTLSELFGGEEVRHTLNGHMSHLGHMDRKSLQSGTKHNKRPSSSVLDLGFSLDPLLADEKC